MSNKKTLTALKSWSQYLLGKDFCSNDRNEDKFHKLADENDIHYAKLIGNKKKMNILKIASNIDKCVNGDCQNGEGTLTYPGNKVLL